MNPIQNTNIKSQAVYQPQAPLAQVAPVSPPTPVTTKQQLAQYQQLLSQEEGKIQAIEQAAQPTVQQINVVRGQLSENMTTLGNWKQYLNDLRQAGNPINAPHSEAQALQVIFTLEQNIGYLQAQEQSLTAQLNSYGAQHRSLSENCVPLRAAVQVLQYVDAKETERAQVEANLSSLQQFIHSKEADRARLALHWNFFPPEQHAERNLIWSNNEKILAEAKSQENQLQAQHQALQLEIVKVKLHPQFLSFFQPQYAPQPALTPPTPNVTLQPPLIPTTSSKEVPAPVVVAQPQIPAESKRSEPSLANRVSVVHETPAALSKDSKFREAIKTIAEAVGKFFDYLASFLPTKRETSLPNVTKETLPRIHVNPEPLYQERKIEKQRKTVNFSRRSEAHQQAKKQVVGTLSPSERQSIATARKSEREGIAKEEEAAPFIFSTPLPLEDWTNPRTGEISQGLYTMREMFKAGQSFDVSQGNTERAKKAASFVEDLDSLIADGEKPLEDKHGPFYINSAQQQTLRNTHNDPERRDSIILPPKPEQAPQITPEKLEEIQKDVEEVARASAEKVHQEAVQYNKETPAPEVTGKKTKSLKPAMGGARKKKGGVRFAEEAEVRVVVQDPSKGTRHERHAEVKTTLKG